jgi:hypothetical protein
MSNSVRTYLAAGGAAAVVSTMALSPVPGSEARSRPQPMATSTARLDLAASVKPLVQPITLPQLVTARTAIEALDPAAASQLPDSKLLAAAPAPLNAASDVIVSV